MAHVYVLFNRAHVGEISDSPHRRLIDLYTNPLGSVASVHFSPPKKTCTNPISTRTNYMNRGFPTLSGKCLAFSNIFFPVASIPIGFEGPVGLFGAFGSVWVGLWVLARLQASAHGPFWSFWHLHHEGTGEFSLVPCGRGSSHPKLVISDNWMVNAMLNFYVFFENSRPTSLPDSILLALLPAANAAEGALPLRQRVPLILSWCG